VPLANYVGYISQDMDTNSFDRHLSHTITHWMNGAVGDGEEGIISRNDALFSVYMHLARLGKFSRNKHEDSTVDTTRSDRTDKYEGVSLVKIEEKDNSMAEAVEDLRRKAVWLPHYARMPFIFGIAVTPDQLEIYTLHQNNSIVKVFSANLTDPVDRWSCVVAAVNIARTLKMFVEQGWVITSLQFNKWHQRNTKRIRLEQTFAEVEFHNDVQFDRMRKFYTATAAVPHLEHSMAFNADKKRICLIPVGVQRHPCNVIELVAAVKHIFECLFQLHGLGYVHCDIRWNNMIEVFGDWFVIDCEYACYVDEQDLLTTRASSTIKPAFVLDMSKPWSALFDMYQVGKLLQESSFTSENPDLVALRDLLLSKDYAVATVKRAVRNL